MQTMLITGINGFLGSKLAKAFSDDYNIIGLEYGLDNLYRIKDCNYKMYDVREGVPNKVFTDQKIDIIIHAATFYGRENESVCVLANANLFLPFDLLDQAIKNNCQLFINTDTILDRFTSFYSLSKRHFQEWLYMRRGEIQVLNLMLEHFYGPSASATNFISTMIQRLKNNESNIELTLGEQKRDFVYIDDIVSAYKIALRSTLKINERYLSYHIGTGDLISIKELLILLKGLTNSHSNLDFGAISYRENEQKTDINAIPSLSQIGWNPKTRLQEGLYKTVKHYGNQESS